VVEGSDEVGKVRTDWYISCPVSVMIQVGRQFVPVGLGGQGER
jgi:hypothetical protein